jgi:hypothetical protein
MTAVSTTIPVTNRAAAIGYLERLEAQRGPVPHWYLVAKMTGDCARAGTAWLEWAGWDRHPGSRKQLAEALAEAVISVYAVAEKAGIILDAAVRDRYEILIHRDLRAGAGKERQSS